MHPQISDQAFNGIKNCGSKRLELSFKNTISFQLIFLYHGFEDAFYPKKSSHFFPIWSINK